MTDNAASPVRPFSELRRLVLDRPGARERIDVIKAETMDVAAPIVAIDADGFWWRCYDDEGYWSMVPTNSSNSPIPHPVRRFRLVPLEGTSESPPSRSSAGSPAGGAVPARSGPASLSGGDTPTDSTALPEPSPAAGDVPVSPPPFAAGVAGRDRDNNETGET
jgi:hypothetical protein